MLSLFAYPAMLKYVEAIALFVKVNVYPTKPKSVETRREPGWIYTYNGNCKSYRRTSKNHISKKIDI